METEPVAPAPAAGASPITVSKVAAVRLHDELKRRGASPASKALRVMLFPGGCAGLTYAMSFTDKTPEEFERVYESEGLRLYVDHRYEDVLRGSTITFVDSLIGGGFKVENPNAQHACGCGKSFS